MRTKLFIILSLGLIFISSPAVIAEENHDEQEEREDQEENEEYEEDIIDFIKEYIPEALEELEDSEDEEALEEFGELMEEYYEIAEESKTEAEAFIKPIKLQFKSFKLADEISEEKDKSKKAVKIKKLRETLESIFELQITNHEGNVEELKKETEEITEMIQRRKRNKEKIIDKRLKELTTSESEDLEWW